MKKKALVTGAAGFIASHLVGRLLEEGFDQVIGIDCLTDYYSPERKLDNVARNESNRFEFVRADLNELEDLSDKLDDVTHIFHLAGQPGVRGSWGGQFTAYVRNNVSATQRLLEMAANLRSLESFVYASSSSIYGDAEAYPTTESDRPMPRSPYGVTKLAAEHLCGVYAKWHSVPTVSLRFFTVYGPRQRPDMAFPRFIAALRDGKSLPVYGDGHQVRDFTFVTDVVDANYRVAVGDVAPGSVFNVSGGTSASVREVIAELEDITGRTAIVDFQEPVDGDVQRTSGGVEAIHSAVGWSPRVGLRAGLEAQWAAATDIRKT